MSRAPAHTPSLEPSTLLHRDLGAYAVTVYPEAGEASIVRVTAGHQSQREPPRRTEEEKRAASAARGSQRAKARIRRYTRCNRLRFLWTLTYATARRARAEAGADMRRFMEAIRREYGRLPLVAVCEPHPGGHGWHWHFACAQRLPVKRVRALWGHGHVWVGDPGKLAARVPPRKLSAYLSKYVSKSADADAPQAPGVDQREAGEHRYRVTEGFDPSRWTCRVTDPADGYSLLHMLYGAEDKCVAFALGDGAREDCWWLSYPDRWLWPKPPEPPPETEGADDRP